MSKKNMCLINEEVKYYQMGETKGELTFKGWNIKNPEQLIADELEEYFENEINFVKVLEKKEGSYACPNYHDGEAAKNEGFTHFIEYRDKYKNGLGKCTHFKFEFELLDDSYY